MSKVNGTVVSTPLAQVTTPLLALALPQGGTVPPSLVELDRAVGGVVGRAITSGDFKGKRDESALLYPGGGKAERVLLVGLGKPGEVTRSSIRRAAAVAAKRARSLGAGAQHFAFAVAREARNGVAGKDLGQVVVEGAAQGAWAFTELKAAPEDPKPDVESVAIVCDPQEAKDVGAGQRIGDAVAAGHALARYLQIQPGNVCTPSYLADRAKQLADPVERGEGEAVRVGELPRAIGEIARRADVAGLDLEVARERVTGGHGVPDPLARPDILRFLRIAHDRDALDVGLRVLGGRLELGERPRALRGALHHHLAQILSRHAVPRLARHGEGEVLRTWTQRPRPLRRHGGGSPDGAAGYLARLPQADEQHALRLAAARVEQRALVPLALEVTARDGPSHHTAHRAVQLDERWGNRAALRERQGEERGGDLREGGGDDRTVHLRHARLCTRRRRRSRPRWRRASGGPGRR